MYVCMYVATYIAIWLANSYVTIPYNYDVYILYVFLYYLQQFKSYYVAKLNVFYSTLLILLLKL